MTSRKAKPRELAGRTLGEWIVGEPIGSGGFADVYLARQPRLERDAVIKVLRSGSETPRRAEDFKREAKLASQLDHPYAAHVYSFGVEDDGLLWIAMELVRGKSLRAMLLEDGSIEVARFVPLFERLCEVVHSAHEVGLIHRDIKPANVMVITRAGRLLPKLLDFGIALTPTSASDSSADLGDLGDEDTEVIEAANLDTDWTADTDDEATPDADRTKREHPPDATPRVSGTPAYMAPEQWRGELLDHRADIYALGVLAHQCLSGDLPFRATSAAEYLLMHVREPIPELPSTFPAKLRAALMRALEKNRSDRFASALEFAAAVRSAGLPRAKLSLPRPVATPWLVTAPTHLGDALVSFQAAPENEQAFALSAFLTALARWLGVTALAASASRGPKLVPEADTVRTRTLSLRDWLDLGEAVCRPFVGRPEDFPIPELARWFDSKGGGREQLLTIESMCSGAAEIGEAAYQLLASVLSSLEFVCCYGLEFADDSMVVLTDGDGLSHLQLSPLVARVPPTPGGQQELFIVSGPGVEPGQSRLVSVPSGFLLENDAIAPWLESNFGLGPVPQRPETELERAPYRGLRRFGREDAGVFFGRNRDVQALYNRLLAQSFVALTGPSGSGKSSLIFAGLLGRLPDDDWSVIAMNPAATPVATLASILASLPAGVGDFESDVDAVPEWLAADRRQLLIVVDQAEELLTLTRADEAQRFVELLTRLASSPRIKILITIRDDFIGRAGDELPGWSQYLTSGLLLVSSATREELSNMIVGPAKRVGYDFDDDALVDDMVDEVVGQPGALPLLSFAASRLWNQRDRERRLLLRSVYREMGGVVGALARYAEDVLAALPTQSQAVVRQLFRRLVTGSGTRSVVLRSDLATTPLELRVLEHLITARLVVASEGEDGREYLSIVHETLLVRWPRLSRWQQEDTAGLQFRDELRAAAAAWEEHAREPGYPWRGAAGSNLERWRRSWSDRLSSGELAFANASRAEASRSTRRRRFLFGGALAVLVAALLVLLAFNRRAELSRERAEANRAETEETLTEMLASRGFVELVAERRRRALVYLTAAYERGRDTAGLRIALAKAAEGVETFIGKTRAHRGRTIIERRAIDAKCFTSFSPNERAKVWEWQTGTGFVLVGEFGDAADDIGVLADGGEVAATYGNHRLRVWKADGELLADVHHPLQTAALNFSPDAKTIVTGWSGAVAVFDLTGKRVATLGEEGEASVMRLGFTPDQAVVVSVLATGRTLIFDFDARTEAHNLDFDSRPSTMHFAADSKRIFLGFEDGRMVVVDVASGEIVLERKLQDVPLHVAFYPDRSRFLLSGAAGRLRVIDAKTLRDVANFGAGQGFMAGIPSSKGNYIVTGDGSLIGIWDAQHYQQLFSFDVGHKVSSYFMSADEKMVVVGSADGTMSAWDVSGRDALTIYREHRKGKNDGSVSKAWHAAFSPNGELVASFESGRALLWDPETGETTKTLDLGELRPHGMPTCEFSADGKSLLLPSDRQVTIFDVETGLKRARVTRDIVGSAMAWGPDGLVGSSTVNLTGETAYINVFDSESERLVAERPTTSLALDVEFLPGEGLLYCTDAETGLWDFRSNSIVWQRTASDCDDITLNAKNALMTTSGAGGFIKIRNARTGRLVRQLPAPDVFHSAVAFDKGDGLLATASSNQKIYIWAPDSNTPVAVLSGHTANTRSLEFSDQGRLVSVDNDGNVIVWEIPRESRSPADLRRLIAKYVPFKLEGAEVVPRSEPESEPGGDAGPIDAGVGLD